MCYFKLDNNKPISQEEIRLGIASEVELAKKLDIELVEAYHSKDHDRILAAVQNVYREGGITWRLRECITVLLKT